MGINTGILQNATPLSAAQVRELERKVLENGEAFAYLDENNQLCFMSKDNPEAIKELAWNNAYKLVAGQDGLVRAEYKKDSLKTYFLDKVSIKDSLDGAWLADDVLEGTGAEYYTSAPSTLSFRSTAPLSEFQEVTVNGQTVDPSNYTLEEGSTIVKLSIDYLKTLDVGNYDVAVVSENRTVRGNFFVKAPILSEYGFYYNMPYIALNDDGTLVFAVVFDSKILAEVENSDLKARSLIVYSLDEDSYGLGGFAYCVYDGIIHVGIDGAMEPVANITDEGISFEESLGVFCVPSTNCAVLCTDNNYAYVYLEAQNSYAFCPINRQVEFYNTPIKTNINNIPVSAIADMAFAESYIKTFDIPEIITSIGNGAFYGCKSLRTVHIPDSIVSIGHEAFSFAFDATDDSSPNSVFIGGGVINIGENAFASSALKTVTFAENINLINLSGGAFFGCNIETVDLPDSIVTIEPTAFQMCEALTSITLGDKIASIGDFAFGHCDALTNISFKGTIAQWNSINKGVDWNRGVPATEVQCSDGKVSLI